MPGKVIGKAFNLGYAGDISRSVDPIVDSRVVKSNIVGGVEQNASVAFGEPVILNTDGTYTRFGSTGTAATFAGVAVREVKQATDYFNGNGSYLPSERADVLTRGSMVVLCNNGTPTAGGTVYVRITANAAIPKGVVGQFEAVADGSNTVALNNVVFKTGQLDANGVAEIVIRTINLA